MNCLKVLNYFAWLVTLRMTIMTRFHRKINMTLDWMYNHFFFKNHKYMNSISKIMNNHSHVFPWLSNVFLLLTIVFGFCFVQHGTTWNFHFVYYWNNNNSKMNLNLQNKTKYFYFKTLYLSIESIKLYRWGWGSIYIVWMAVKTTHAKMISFSEVILSNKVTPSQMMAVYLSEENFL